MSGERGFGSDNHATVHPDILQALSDANRDHAPSYGGDRWTEEALRLFKQEFGTDIDVLFVFNGTAANVLALSSCLRPSEAVFCSDVAHIHVDEAAAPERFTGCKLWPLPSQDGKLTMEALNQAWVRRGDIHYPQAKVLSITQPTEVGTLYSLEEIRNIASWAKERNLLVHMDGARFGVAAAALKTTFRSLTKDLGVDVLSFGGTKNGLMFGEAVIFLNSKTAAHAAVLRKQMGQLPSKTRFVSAQFCAYLKNGLWKEIAERSLRQARRLHEGVIGLKQVKITRPVQSNAVFACIPKSWTKPLREKSFFYVWDESTWECRWMTSWDLQDTDIDDFVKNLKELDA